MANNYQNSSFFIPDNDYLENQARLEAEQRELDRKKALNEHGRRNFDDLVRNLQIREANGEDISQDLIALQNTTGHNLGPLRVVIPPHPQRTIQAVPPPSISATLPNVSHAGPSWQNRPNQSWPQGNSSGTQIAGSSSSRQHEAYRPAAEQSNSGVISLVSPQVQQTQYQNTSYYPSHQSWPSQGPSSTSYYRPAYNDFTQVSSAPVKALTSNSSSLAGALGETATTGAKSSTGKSQTTPSTTSQTAAQDTYANRSLPSKAPVSITDRQREYSPERAKRISSNCKIQIRDWTPTAPPNSHFVVKGTRFRVYKDLNNKLWFVIPRKRANVYASLARMDEIFEKYFYACRSGLYEDETGKVFNYVGDLTPEMQAKWHVYFDPVAFGIKGDDVVEISPRTEGATSSSRAGASTSSTANNSITTSTNSVPTTATTTTSQPTKPTQGDSSQQTVPSSSAAIPSAVAIVPPRPTSPPPPPTLPPDDTHTAGPSATLTNTNNSSRGPTAPISYAPQSKPMPPTRVPVAPQYVEHEPQPNNLPPRHPIQPPPMTIAINSVSTAQPQEKTALREKLSHLVGPDKYLARDILIALGFTSRGQKRPFQAGNAQEGVAKRRAVEASDPHPLASSSSTLAPDITLPVALPVPVSSLPPFVNASTSALLQPLVPLPEPTTFQPLSIAEVEMTPIEQSSTPIEQPSTIIEQSSPPPLARISLDTPQVTIDDVHLPRPPQVPQPHREIIVIEDTPTPPTSNRATPPPITPPTLPISSPPTSAAARSSPVPPPAHSKSPIPSTSPGFNLSTQSPAPEGHASRSSSTRQEQGQGQTKTGKGKQKEQEQLSTDRSSLDVDVNVSDSRGASASRGGTAKDNHKPGFQKESSLDIARLRSPSLPPPPSLRRSTMPREPSRSLSPLDMQGLPVPDEISTMSLQGQQEEPQQQPPLPLFLPSPSSSRSSLDMAGGSRRGDASRKGSSVELMDTASDGSEVRRYPLVNKAYVLVPPRPQYVKRDLAKKAGPSKQKSGSSTSRRSVSEVAAEFQNFGVTPAVVDPEEEEVARLARSRLCAKECSWNGCDSVLNSDEHLLEHLLQHQRDTQTKLCLWRGCGQTLRIGPQIKEHLSIHGMRLLICPYQGCEESRSSSRLLRHTKAQHANGTLKPAAMPYKPQKVDRPPNAPHSMPSYMIESRHIIQHTMTPDRHAKLGPWVLRNIAGPVSLPTKRYNAALPLPKRWTVSDNGEIRRPEFSEYEFLTSSSLPFSTSPSKPAKQKVWGNLDSCRVSQLVSDGLVLWHSGDGDPGRRLSRTLDEVKEEGGTVGVGAGRKYGGLQSDEEAVELMLTER